jgi:hypothetical protein
MDNKTIDETNIQEVVDIPMTGKKNVIMDATILTTLMNCARSADFRFNMNLHSIHGKSNSLEVGSTVHKYLETYYGSIIKGLERKKAHEFGMAAGELYVRGCHSCTDFVPTHNHPDGEVCNEECVKKPICGHPPNEYPGLKNTPPDNEGYKVGWKWALESCEQYNAFYANDHWVPLEVEVVKSRIIYEDDEIRVLWKAKFDLVSDTNQGIFPIDHKTMKQRRATTRLNNQFMGQCLLQGTRNVIINKFGFQTTLKPNEKFERAPVSYSAGQLTEWYSETVPFYAKLLLMYAETGYFPPNFSNCDGKFGRCPFAEVCEADASMREEELKRLFIVGPEWNPTNTEGDD